MARQRGRKGGRKEKWEMERRGREESKEGRSEKEIRFGLNPQTQITVATSLLPIHKILAPTPVSTVTQALNIQCMI